MRRFYIPPAEAVGDVLILSEAESHHAFNVLRVERGEEVIALDGAGCEMLCRVRSATKREVSLDVLERRTHPVPACKVSLFQAVPKGSLMDDIVEKAAELGATRIVPVLTARTEARFDAKSATRKTEKWRHTAIEALKQCGSPWLPEISGPLPFRDALAFKEQFELFVFGSLHDGARRPREVVQKFHDARGRLPQSLAIWIGPEGDFTPEELAALESAGAQPVTLGPRVLRCVTAAVSCLAVFNAELDSRR
ncbi:MAG: 16S rRNA (uracil(1498)-N(3))-methyltransferase [Verrucomicrobia bacterium]|nr:16S rRNA (uracil(1498)-N(3))-methyltransferase [Verrucomicrobiota bacterium]